VLVIEIAIQGDQHGEVLRFQEIGAHQAVLGVGLAVALR
jgi:hypothetical protein